jgi:hypothetical protein
MSCVSFLILCEKSESHWNMQERSTHTRARISVLFYTQTIYTYAFSSAPLETQFTWFHQASSFREQFPGVVRTILNLSKAAASPRHCFVARRGFFFEPGSFGLRERRDETPHQYYNKRARRIVYVCVGVAGARGTISPGRRQRKGVRFHLHPPGPQWGPPCE